MQIPLNFYFWQCTETWGDKKRRFKTEKLDFFILDSKWIYSFGKEVFMIIEILRKNRQKQKLGNDSINMPAETI